MTKKLLLFVVTAALALAGYAAVPGQTKSLRHANAPKRSVIAQVKKQAPQKAAPESDTWNNIGEGTYVEDLLTFFNDVPSGLRWKVNVEQSKEHPGWYRIMPYAEGSLMAELMAEPDSSYLYFNATDPDKVYAEDFYPYGCEISNLTTTTGWPTGGDYERYGTFAEGIISFMPGSFAIGIPGNESWYPTSSHEGVQLAMPGVELPDYTVGMGVPFCAPDNKFELQLYIGSSIANLYLLLREGEWRVEDDYLEYDVIDFGTAYTSDTKKVTFTPEEPGLYTILAVGEDKDENIVFMGQQCIICVNSDGSDWKTLGTGKMTEGVYSAIYDVFEPETIICEVQESKSKPGMYRLRDPYYVHSMMSNYMIGKDEHSHPHDIYINATDPNHVYVEPSAIGVTYNGDAAIWSAAGSSLNLGFDPEDIEEAGQYGQLKDNVITMPDGELLIGEKNFYGGEFFNCGQDFRVELPDLGGVSDITVDAASDAPVYYNLQGVRIDKPAAGQLYISVSNGKAEKHVAR